MASDSYLGGRLQAQIVRPRACVYVGGKEISGYGHACVIRRYEAEAMLFR